MTKKNNLISYIPNFITVLNLICGSLAIVLSFELEDKLIYASYLIGIAAVLDFLDGFAARMLKAQSAIGKQLDSLADLISFGLAPSVIMFHLLKMSLMKIEIPLLSKSLQENIHSIFKQAVSSLHIDAITVSSTDILILSTAVLVVVFSALRLAKFNVDTRQGSSFIGLGTPANALLIASLPLVLVHHPELKKYIIDTYTLIIFIFVSSYLLISEIPMFSLKLSTYSLKNNIIQYLFLLISLILLLWIQYLGIPFIIVLYIVMSIINNLTSIRVGKG